MRQVLELGGLDSADLEARRLVEAATGIPFTKVPTFDGFDEPIRNAVLRLAHRRVAGEPLQYVTGIAGFRNLELHVGPGVFIPRPETELVAGKAMSVLRRDGVLVDLGTGSGAIALAVADERPDAETIGTELSEAAIEWAERNIAATGLKVRLFRGDMFAALPTELRGRVDVIVSNPPYIPPGDSHLLPVEVARHEPGVALFSDAGGLGTISRLVGGAADWLRAGGWLVLEIGDRQDEAVARLMEDAGFVRVTIEPDLAGRPRIAAAMRAD